MRSPLAVAALCTVLLALAALGLANGPSSPPDQEGWQVAQLFRTDSTDTTRHDPFAGNRDSTAAKDTSKIIVKRDFVHKEQVVMGSTIMIFCIFILVSMANWNPQ